MNIFSKAMQVILGINIVLGFIFFGIVVYRLIGYASFLITSIFIFLVVIGLQKMLDEHRNKVLKDAEITKTYLGG